MVSYADRPWTDHYDTGIPASLMPYPDVPLFQLLDNTARTHPNNTACLTPLKVPGQGMAAHEMTYRELAELSDRLAGALTAMGVSKGDRVALVLPNCSQFVVAFFGALKAGAVVVALNPTFPPLRWAEQLNDGAVKVVITLAPFYDGLNSVRAQTGVECLIVTRLEEYLPAGSSREEPELNLQPDDFWLQNILSRYTAADRPTVTVNPAVDTAIFQYTGGTTGVPKAACGPHRALVANAVQLTYWLKGQADPSTERTLAAIPLFHVYGMVVVMIHAVATGAAMVMVRNARDLDELLLTISTFRPALFAGVPAMYNAINQHPGVAAGLYDLSSIRACISGSAPLAPETKLRFEELTGGKLVEGYGMSETPTATHINPVHGLNKAGAIGLPLPDVECRIVRLDEPGVDVPVGEIGELIIRGPVMMTGYHNMPAETANAIRDGWLYTGDIARMDEDGYFYIIDRKKDMVIIGGFNVYPSNIEKVLIGHEAVAEVGVAGVPHPTYAGQEMLKAWVVVKPGRQLTEEDLIAFCGDYLAPYEIPSRIEFVTAIPRTAVGKLLRRELVRMETTRRT